MILKLENTTTHQTYKYEVKDMNHGEKLYFRFDIDTSNLVDGEYALKLYDGDKIIATDILKIGDFNANTLQYKKGENIYIEVKLDESVQDVKNISISTIETTVLPDDGFNSMGKVDVNAQPLYDNAYNIGHTEGYNEGLESSYQVGYDDGYSVGNEEGFNSGYNMGNEDGFNNGINTQKGKLTGITITENGTYTREDGYNSIEVNVPDLNGSYDEGYSDGYLMGEDKGYNKGYTDGIEEGTTNAGEIIAETAQVLNITENGKYLTQYSDPILPEDVITTGIFDDGTEFKNYAYLYNTTYDTGIIPTQNSRLEFWYKDTDEASGDAWYVIIGAGKTDKETLCFQLRRNSNSYCCNWGAISRSFVRPTVNEWHHYIISYTDGIVVDGIKKTDLPTPLTNGDSSFYINSAFYCSGTDGFGGGRFNNGYFGMVKIDGKTFIPTSEGFKNYNTGELLEVVRKITYTYTDTTPIYGEGNLIKTVNVNVTPKLNIAKGKIKFGYSNIEEVPEWADFEGITDMSHMFYQCTSLTTIPLIDTSNVTKFEYCFCATKITELPQLDLSNGINFNEFCYKCGNLKYVPNLDLSSATNINGLLENCNDLISVGEIKVPNITNNVTYFLGSSAKNNLTDFGGLIGLRGSITNNGFNTCPNLTYQSCINILNGLYDFTGNGETPNSSQGNLKVHSNFLTTVGDEISIGINKGWTITA